MSRPSRIAWATVATVLVTISASAHGSGPSPRIKPYAGNRFYWQYKGEPLVLLGGSKDDNLFQLPDLEEHLDEIRAVGGNYIRNTMSDRPDKGFEVYPFKRLGNGKYDLATWNDEYWDRFQRMLQLTHAREIVVQIEIWDRFDYSDHRGRGRWKRHPYNPKNNVNYTTEGSGLRTEYTKHPGRNEQPFFDTVPALENNETVLRFQRAQVDRMLSYSLEYGHVLYCIDNETSGSPEWGRYWASHLRKRAAEAGVEVYVTEMWDQWDPKGPEHRQTFDHPEWYSFVDVSQNNHNRGQVHWDNLAWLRNYLAANPRPINTVKIYGADTGRFGNSRDGEERFWRNILGGTASTRFHRPESGLGLSVRAKAHLRSMRLLLAELDVFQCTPDTESRLLSERDENEAYATSLAGRQYAVYFPDGGSVELDLTEAKGRFTVKWLNIANSRWHDAPAATGRSSVPLDTPGPGHWAVLLTSDL